MRDSGRLAFGQLPVLEVFADAAADADAIAPTAALAQSGAILRYVGKLSGLYPSDPLLAAKVDAILDQEADMLAGVRVARYQERFGFADGTFDRAAVLDALNGAVLPRHIAYVAVCFFLCAAARRPASLSALFSVGPCAPRRLKSPPYPPTTDHSSPALSYSARLKNSSPRAPPGGSPGLPGQPSRTCASSLRSSGFKAVAGDGPRAWVAFQRNSSTLRRAALHSSRSLWPTPRLWRTTHACRERESGHSNQ